MIFYMRYDSFILTEFFTGRFEVVDKILEGLDDFRQTDVFPQTTVTTLGLQRFQCSTQNNEQCIATEKLSSTRSGVCQ